MTMCRNTAAALLLAACAACSDGPTGSRGEGGGTDGPQGVQLQPGTAVAASVSATDSVRWFWVRGPITWPQAARIRLEATSGSASDTIEAVLTDTAGVPLHVASIRSAGSDSGPADGTRITLASTQMVRVAVRARSGGGPFRLELSAPGTPDGAAGAISLGQVFEGEIFNQPGDYDAFTLSVSQPVQTVTYLQGRTGAATDEFTITVYDAAGRDLGGTLSRGTDAELESQSSSRITLAPGTYRVEVHGRYGPYRAQLLLLDPLPEDNPAALRVGDTTHAEQIAHVGDVDEFSFAGTAGESVELFVQTLNGLKAGVDVQVLQGTQVLAQGTTAGPVANLDTWWLGPFTVPVSGTYRVRFSGHARSRPDDPLSRADATGGYRAELYRIDPRPEHLPAGIAYGQTLRGESLDRPGDIDEFTFQGTAGSQLGASMVVQSGASNFGILAVAPSGGRYGAFELSPVRAPDGAWFNAGGFRPLAESGQYRLIVNSVRVMGPYELQFYPLSTAPETAPDTVSIGGTVSSESIDHALDVDQFAFTGAIGQMFTIVVHAPADRNVYAYYMEQPGVPPFGVAYAGAGGTRSSNRIVLETSGTHVLQVTDNNSPSLQYFAAPARYQVTLRPVNTAPEALPATFLVGDTVKGEGLDPVGDVDEFTFAAKAGDKLAVWLSMPQAFWLVACEVLDTSGNQVAFTSHSSTAPGAFVAPYSGAYRVRIYSSITGRSTGEYDDKQVGPYTFRVFRR
jgi:hypothetical protein